MIYPLRVATWGGSVLGDNGNDRVRGATLTRLDNVHIFLPIGRKNPPIMIQEKLALDLSKPILKQIIQPLGINYTEFAKRLEIGLTTLEHYRRGTRQFKLTVRQFKILLCLLREVGLTIEELPDDWIIEK